MSFYGQYTGFGGGGGAVYESFITILGDLSLTTGLKLCLDAGDSVSYTSGEDWIDRSGNLGSDEFHRGSDETSSDSADPTFNGAVGGLSKNEYFSFDGGDYFRYGASNEAWMETLHKDGAEYSWMSWTYGNNGQGYWGTGRTGNVGVNLRSNEPHLQIVGANAATITTNTGASWPPGTAWSLKGVSYDENGGSSGCFFFSDGGYIQGDVLGGTYDNDTWDGAYNSPSTASAAFVMDLYSRGGAGGPASANVRVAGIFFWQGTVLSKANMDSFYTATRTRFGV